MNQQYPQVILIIIVQMVIHQQKCYIMMETIEATIVVCYSGRLTCSSTMASMTEASGDAALKLLKEPEAGGEKGR